MCRYLICLSPHVNLLVDVDTRDDKEDAGSPGSTGEKTTQPEDDRSLVLLDDLDGHEEGEGQGGHDDQDGGEGEEVGADTRTFLTGCK